MNSFFLSFMLRGALIGDNFAFFNLFFFLLFLAHISPQSIPK